MKPPALEYVRPGSLAEAIARLAEDSDATAVAGGQSLVVMLSLRVAGARRLVDIGRLPELSGARETDECVLIGAATTHAAIEDGQIPDPSGGMLAQVASGIAYRAIRHFGTMGGALCLADPAADWPVCLIALGASLRIAGPSGERVVPATEFVTGAYTTSLRPGEVLRAIEIRRLPAFGRWGWVKLARKQGAYADSLAAAVSRGPEAPPAIVLGATASGPKKLEAVAASLHADPDLDISRLRDVIRHDVAASDDAADTFRLRWHAASVERAIAQMRRR
jgi:carbon-monoxide dehydrogenase medium subunit